MQFPSESPDAMSRQPNILFVDDEPSVLRAIERNLRTSGMALRTALSGAEALVMLENEPADVLVSDMRMPHMDGAQLLAIARDRWPDTVRILLTGHADHADTVRAINAGKLFGYLNKPWDPDGLVATVRSAANLAQLGRDKRRLEAENATQAEALAASHATLEIRVEERTAEVQAAHARMKRNYMNSIKAFANLIELRGGQGVGHGRRVADMARSLARTMKCDEDQAQRIFIAGLLHDIGLIGMPDSAQTKPVASLDGEMQAIYRRHASLGSQSLIGMDDMQPIAALIRSHHERYDGKGFPESLVGEEIELGARILAVADQYDELASGAFGSPALTAVSARAVMERGRGTQFDPLVLDAMQRLAKAAGMRRDVPPSPIGWAWIEPGMELAKDLRSNEGALLLAADQTLDAELVERIRNYARREAPRLEVQIRCSTPATVRARTAYEKSLKIGVPEAAV